MSCATFYFYPDLNKFLPPFRRHTPLSNTFDRRVSIKDMIESIGVPHTEIETIIVNDCSEDFSYIVQDGDLIHVYPPSVAIDVSPLKPLRPPLPAEPRFVLDTHLGQLATYLRMLGFDTLYRNDFPDDELAQISSTEKRILLTRDRGLLKRGIVTYGHFMRETNPQRQVIEVLRRYNLVQVVNPGQRCVRCNGMISPVDKETVGDRLHAKTLKYYDEFYTCDSCDRIYWKGSHYEQMQQFIERVIREA